MSQLKFQSVGSCGENLTETLWPVGLAQEIARIETFGQGRDGQFNILRDEQF